MPGATLKIQNARFILTVDPQRRIIRDGSILVEGQRITRLGKASELNSVSAYRVIDAREMVVTPGFVNGHMHISYAHAVRGVFPDDLGREYLPNVFRLQAAMTEDEEYYTSLLAITELLKYGTTCFLDPGSTKYLDRCLQAYQESGCRIIVGAQVVDRPNSLNLPVFKASDAIDRMEQTISAYNNRLDGRIKVWAMPFSAALASSGLLVAAKELADKYQTGMTLHHNNSATFVEACVQQYGRRPTQYLESLGVLGANVTLAHCLGIDQSEVDCLARTHTRVVMCPTAAIKGGVGMTRYGLLPEMLMQGVTVGLGTDAGNNSNLLESLRSMYLAAVLYKDSRQDVKMVPAESALEMATIGGAAALGLADDIGSIEVGKKADLLLFDTRRPEWRALFNPVNSLVYNADGRSVHTVIIDGNVVVEGHQPLFVDEWGLIQKVQAIGEDLLSRTGVSYPSRWPVV
jgi:5-methylthioadenosine/S-adenosylhomocysteine deaminase